MNVDILTKIKWLGCICSFTVYIIFKQPTFFLILWIPQVLQGSQ